MVNGVIQYSSLALVLYFGWDYHLKIIIGSKPVYLSISYYSVDSLFRPLIEFAIHCRSNHNYVLLVTTQMTEPGVGGGGGNLSMTLSTSPLSYIYCIDSPPLVKHTSR